MNNKRRTTLCLGLTAAAVGLAFAAALLLGRYPLTLASLLAGDAMAVRTFTVLRLPRAVMALLGGLGLGVAGFVYQTVFRNPLASPDIIGVSSGASVGAAFAILFVSSGAVSTTVCAFAGGLLAVLLSELIGEILERIQRGGKRPMREFKNGEFIEREGEK